MRCFVIIFIIEIRTFSWIVAIACFTLAGVMYYRFLSEWQEGVPHGPETLVTGVMGKLVATGAVAGCEDVRLTRSQLLVYLGAAGPVIDFGLLKFQTLNLRPSSDGDRYCAGFHLTPIA